MFSSLKIIIYLQINSLDFYSPDGTHFSFPITPDLIENLEIKNKIKLEEDLLKFLTENKIKKGSSLLVLSEEILFRKDIGERDPQVIKEKLNLFLNEIPLDPKKIFYKILEVKDRYSLVGVNKELYEAILAPLRKYGIKITSVTPLTASWVGDITKDTLSDFIADKKNLSRANFLQKSITTEELQENPLASIGLNKTLLIIIVLCSLIIGSFLFYFLTLSNTKKPEQEEININIPTITLKTSPTPISEVNSEETVDKEKIKLRVLNGNGGTGVATKAKGILEAAGYQNIKIDNAGKYDYENTLIQVKKDNTVLFKTLASDLENDYTLEKTPEELASDSPYDAVIIIGLK